MLRVILVEARESVRRQLLLALRADGIDAEAVPGVDAASTLLLDGKGGVGAVLLGYETAPVAEVLALCAASSSSARAPGVIVVLGGDDREAGLAALRQGALDFVCLPSTERPGAGLALALLKMEARRAAGAEGPGAPARQGSAGGADRAAAGARPPALIGSTPGMIALAATIRRLAAARASVLIGGESGTGKELVAQALHRESPWAAGPFVPVNCGAISRGLIESELFGHVRGAFTDAHRDKRGLFESASGGTLFLDEIADLPLELQPKLLRAIQEGEIRRVGDVEDLRVQVRVVAATARDLLAEVEAGRFRADLYYRLGALTLQIPPLRERRGDIPALAEHFLQRARARLGVDVSRISGEAMQVLVAHGWPGNVRELENTIERAAVMCGGTEIDVASLPERVLPPGPGPSPASSPASAATPGEASSTPGTEVGQPNGDDLSIKRAARRSEEGLIRRALARTAGNRTRAADLLEISPRALLYKIKEYGIFDKGLPPNGDGDGDGNVRDDGT